MIKFFRSIRHRLLKENRVTRYLLYALGEILLVMIGILLALQVNNWNQSIKETKLEYDYLKRLKNDLKKDSSRLNLHMDILNTKADILKALLKGQVDSIEYHNIVNNPYTIFATRSVHAANLNTATFDDLISCLLYTSPSPRDS